jgi:methylphosphotriester-DNA--protein-cysteine methyltransferase
MIKHARLGDRSFSRNRILKILLDQGTISIAGNMKLKIYGKLNCTSGKRMKITNRVFFASDQEAQNLGYRPCGHCMRSEYVKWKGLN